MVDKWDTKGIAYRGVLVFVIFVGAMTAGFNLPTVPGSMCQVVNGMLPFLGAYLLLCINDATVMEAAPQTADSTLLIVSVSFTVFLAAVGILDKVCIDSNRPFMHATLASTQLSSPQPSYIHSILAYRSTTMLQPRRRAKTSSRRRRTR